MADDDERLRLLESRLTRIEAQIERLNEVTRRKIKSDSDLMAILAKDLDGNDARLLSLEFVLAELLNIMDRRTIVFDGAGRRLAELENDLLMRSRSATGDVTRLVQAVRKQLERLGC